MLCSKVSVFHWNASGRNLLCRQLCGRHIRLLPILYLNNNPIRGTFIRNHEGDYHCPKEMLTMMMRDASQDGNDRLFLEYYTMDDIDLPTLERYRQHFHYICCSLLGHHGAYCPRSGTDAQAAGIRHRCDSARRFKRKDHQKASSAELCGTAGHHDLSSDSVGYLP